MSVSKAQKKAIAKYEAEKIERVTLRLKKGTKKRIIATGAESINGYIIKAVEEKLEWDEENEHNEDYDYENNPGYQECLESHLKALEEMDKMTEEETYWPFNNKK